MEMGRQSHHVGVTTLERLDHRRAFEQLINNSSEHLNELATISFIFSATLVYKELSIKYLFLLYFKNPKDFKPGLFHLSRLPELRIRFLFAIVSDI
jgi:hypothetical protein